MPSTQICVYIRPDQAARLEAEENMSRVVRESLDLYYKKKEEERPMKIVVIEAGDTHTDRREAFEALLAGTVEELVKQAMDLVADRGYQVLKDSEGGCNEYVQTIADEEEDYIAVTVREEEE